MTEFPTLKDWNYSKCSTESYNKCDNEEFIRHTLQSMYTIANPGGMKAMRHPKSIENEDRLTELIDEISVILLGGVPNSFSEHT